MSDAAAWVKQHKAASAAGAAALVVLILYLHRRNVAAKNQQQPSATDSATGATTLGAGQFIVPYNNATDPTGQSTSVVDPNGSLATALTGLTGALNNLATSRNTDPTSTTGGGHAGHGHGTPHPHPGGPPIPIDHPFPHPTPAPSPTPGGSGNGGQTGQTSTPGGATSTYRFPVSTVNMNRILGRPTPITTLGNIGSSAATAAAFRTTEQTYAAGSPPVPAAQASTPADRAAFDRLTGGYAVGSSMY